MRALIWVACVPLLAPQGVCPCRAFAANANSSESDRIHVSRNVNPTKPRCSCQPDGDAESKASTNPPTSPSHVPAKPCAKCLSADPLTWIEPSFKNFERKPAGLWIPVAEDEFAQSRHDRHSGLVESQVFVRCSIPLFLCHCALVI